MKIHQIPIYNDNYVWIVEGENKQAVVIDPGLGEPVVNALKELNLQVNTILITHHHWDHVTGINDVKALFPEAIVYGPKREEIPQVEQVVSEGQRVNAKGFDLSFKGLEVPGHTRDHVAYLIGDHLFCGDTLFAGGCGRLFEGTPSQMQSSLAKIRGLLDSHPDLTIYCAHEYTQANLTFCLEVDPDNSELIKRVEEVKDARSHNRPTVPFKLEKDLKSNVFLRWDAPEVMKSASQKGALTQEPADVFAAIRSWKDNF